MPKKSKKNVAILIATNRWTDAGGEPCFRAQVKFL